MTKTSTAPEETHPALARLAVRAAGGGSRARTVRGILAWARKHPPPMSPCCLPLSPPIRWRLPELPHGEILAWKHFHTLPSTADLFGHRGAPHTLNTTTLYTAMGNACAGPYGASVGQWRGSRNGVIAAIGVPADSTINKQGVLSIRSARVLAIYDYKVEVDEIALTLLAGVDCLDLMDQDPTRTIYATTPSFSRSRADWDRAQWNRRMLKRADARAEGMEEESYAEYCSGLRKRVLEFAEWFHLNRERLYRSRHARVAGGMARTEESWETYSKGWHATHGPARYQVAGASMNGNIVCLERADGKKRWRFMFGGSLPFDEWELKQ